MHILEAKVQRFIYVFGLRAGVPVWRKKANRHERVFGSLHWRLINVDMKEVLTQEGWLPEQLCMDDISFAPRVSIITAILSRLSSRDICSEHRSGWNIRSVVNVVCLNINYSSRSSDEYAMYLHFLEWPGGP